MKRIRVFFAEKFSFETREMENSYYLANKEVEMKLLGLLQIILTTGLIFYTIVGILVGEVWRETIIRSIIILSSFVTFFIRKCRPNRYKIIMTIFVCTLSFYWLFFNLRVKSQTNFIESFVNGNAMGLLETIFIVSLKTPCFRLFAYAIFFIIKISCLYEDLLIRPHVYIQFLFCVFQIFIFCMYSDILDRRNFSLIYKASEKIKKFQDLLSNDLPSGVIILSSDFGSVLYSNKFFHQQFAANKNNIESTGREIHELFEKLVIQNQEDNNVEIGHSISLFDYFMQIAVQQVIEIQEQDQVKKLYVFHKNEEGDKSHYEVRLRKIVWENKPSYAIVMDDITDKQLVTALKIADTHKDRVIATVSHELRTPINGIIGLLEMSSELTSNKTLLSYLDNCKSCSKLLLYLVNAILDLSQIRNNTLKILKASFSLTEMLDELKSLYIFQSHQKGVEFVIEKESCIQDEIYTDKYRLIEVLINLLGNAMKFTFNGSVKLKITQSERRERYVNFCVEDTGLGIMEKDKSKLFKMFGKIEQANKNINSQGVGLGLTIANELVKALNNNDDKERIMFESEFNKGSRFWFELNVSQPFEKSFLPENDNIERILNSANFDSKDFLEFLDSPHLKFRNHDYQRRFNSEVNPFLAFPKEKEDFILSPKNSGSCLRQKKVLIVDDNPLNLMAAGFILEKLKFSVTKAFNGEEGIRILEKSVRDEENFCLVLTDIQMPVMDGLEMSKIIKDKVKRQEIYSVPVVALTAKKLDEKELERYNECGIVYSLEKPLVKSQIEKIMNNLLR